MAHGGSVASATPLSCIVIRNDAAAAPVPTAAAVCRLGVSRSCDRPAGAAAVGEPQSRTGNRGGESGMERSGDSTMQPSLGIMTNGACPPASGGWSSARSGIACSVRAAAVRNSRASGLTQLAAGGGRLFSSARSCAPARCIVRTGDSPPPLAQLRQTGAHLLQRCCAVLAGGTSPIPNTIGAGRTAAGGRAEPDRAASHVPADARAHYIGRRLSCHENRDRCCCRIANTARPD